MPRRIVLISDLQQGSRLDALGDFEWPSDVELDLKTVADRFQRRPQWLAEPVEARAGRGRRGQRLRVRVSNDAARSRSRSSSAWVDDEGRGPGKPIDVYVPPGESRVVRVPRPPRCGAHRSLRLKGDAHAFDNTLFLAAERKGWRPSSTSATDAPRRSRRVCSITSSASSRTRSAGR